MYTFRMKNMMTMISFSHSDDINHLTIDTCIFSAALQVNLYNPVTINLVWIGGGNEGFIPFDN